MKTRNKQIESNRMKRKASNYRVDSEPEIKQTRFDLDSLEKEHLMSNGLLVKEHEVIRGKKRTRNCLEHEGNEQDLQKKQKINNAQMEIEIPLFHQWKEVTNSFIPLSSSSSSNNEDNSQFNSFNFWRTPFEPVLDPLT